MRWFVACELDAVARLAVATQVRALKDALGSRSSAVRWVPTDKWHITLAFLGALSPTVADAVRAELSVPVRQSPFVVAVGGLGVFPRAGRPRVVWVGVQDHGQELVRLRREIGERLRRAGVEDTVEQRFHPHVTVGRVGAPRGGLAVAITASGPLLASASGRSGVDHVTLFDSRVVDRRSLYDPVLQTSLCWTPTSS